MITSPPSSAWRLIIRAELGELSRLSGWAEDFAQQAKLPSGQSFAIQLGVEEAVANIIKYSGAGENGQDITLELAASGQDVLAVIEDSGCPFDPTTAPPPSKPASLADARIGGLGIHLMRNFASEMRYERRDGRNRLALKFSPAEAASKEPA
jgi:anti-sigma regulatory factor (Ser/Thr protein kinase)